MEKRLLHMLLIDVKGAFDHVSRNGLMCKIEVLGADEDLVRWTGSFELERKVSLVEDDHQCEDMEVETAVS